MIPAIGYMKVGGAKPLDLLTGLQAYWKFEETTGILYDSHNSHNFPDPDFTQGTTGRNNYGVYHDVIDDTVYVTGFGTTLGAASISLWIKPTATSQNATLLGIGRYYGSCLLLQCKNSKAEIILYDGTNENYVESVSSFSLNTWYHLCGVRNPDNGKLELWWNGNLDNSVDLSSTSDISITDRFYLLSYRRIPSTGGNGELRVNYLYLDEAAIYTIALEENQIIALAKPTFYDNF